MKNTRKILFSAALLSSGLRWPRLQRQRNRPMLFILWRMIGNMVIGMLWSASD